MKKRDFRSLFMLLAAGLVFLLSTAGGYAQTKKGLYDVSINNLSLKEALMKVSTQCGYYFVYEDADLASAPKVNKEFKSSTIEQILGSHQLSSTSEVTQSGSSGNLYAEFDI